MRQHDIKTIHGRNASTHGNMTTRSVVVYINTIVQQIKFYRYGHGPFAGIHESRKYDIETYYVYVTELIWHDRSTSIVLRSVTVTARQK